MKRITYLLFVYVAVLCSCTPQIIIPQANSGNSTTDKKVIEWHASRKLTWEDFSGKPSGDLINSAAVTNCGFGFSSNKVTIFNKPKMTVTNVFNPNFSWVQPTQTNRPQLLEHEQLHFDICEVYARRLRKEFTRSNLTYLNIKRKTESIFQQVQKEYLARQDEYERQTNYSLNIQKQNDWRKLIDVELASLEQYSR